MPQLLERFFGFALNVVDYAPAVQLDGAVVNARLSRCLATIQRATEHGRDSHVFMHKIRIALTDESKFGIPGLHNRLKTLRVRVKVNKKEANTGDIRLLNHYCRDHALVDNYSLIETAEFEGESAMTLNIRGDRLSEVGELTLYSIASVSPSVPRKRWKLSIQVTPIPTDAFGVRLEKELTNPTVLTAAFKTRVQLELFETPMARPKSDTVVCSWVHLSDLHVGHGTTTHSWNQARVMEGVVVDIQQALNNSALQIELPQQIFFTGDVAFSGSNGVAPTMGPYRNLKQYDLARAWLENLADTVLQIPRQSIYIVPGNHDVDWSITANTEFIKYMVLSARLKGIDVDQIISKRQSRDALHRRFRHYAEFVRRVGAFGAGELFWSRIADDARRFNIVGLNSALFSWKDDVGKLDLGEVRLNVLSRGIAGGSHPTILLTHHPFEGGWLRDERAATQIAARSPVIHLSGHVHDQRAGAFMSSDGSRYVRFSAGATHPPESEPRDSFGYSFGAVYLRSGRYFVRWWPRRFGGDRWTVDQANLPDGQPYADFHL